MSNQHPSFKSIEALQREVFELREKVRELERRKQLRCDRCGREAHSNGEDWEFSEFTSVDFTAGYASVFEDGHKVQIDLCQHCLKETLGQWLRVTDPFKAFQAILHGGEFPKAA